jgi:EmrB/QacA subfamily drug resistance transporter
VTDEIARSATERPRVSRLAFSAIGAAMVLTSLNFSVSFVAFAEIAESFDASTTTVSWALTAFSITVGALIVPGGWAADRYGRARVFVAGLTVFLFGSGLVAIAPTVELLIAARVLQAAGAAFQSPAMLALMLDAFGSQRRATAVGITGGIGGIAAASGPAIGGALVENVGWRWTFAANLPIGLVILAALLVLLTFEDQSQDRHVPDLFGAVLIIGSVGGLILGIVQSDDWGYFDVRTLTALVCAATLGYALVRRSEHRQNPIINLNLLSIPSFRAGAVLQLLVAGSFGGVFLAELAFLTDAWEYSLFEAGLIIAAIPAVAGPLTVASGRWADRFGHRRVLLPGMLTMAGAGLLLANVVGDQRALWTVWIPLNVLYSIGVGLAHAACQALAVSDVSERELGMGSAMSRISQEIGSALTAAVAITLLAQAANPVAGMQATMTMLVVLTMLGLPTAFRLPRSDTVTPCDSTATSS